MKIQFWRLLSRDRRLATPPIPARTQRKLNHPPRSLHVCSKQIQRNLPKNSAWLLYLNQKERTRAVLPSARLMRPDRVVVAASVLRNFVVRKVECPARTRSTPLRSELPKQSRTIGVLIFYCYFRFCAGRRRLVVWS